MRNQMVHPILPTKRIKIKVRKRNNSKIWKVSNCRGQHSILPIFFIFYFLFFFGCVPFSCSVSLNIRRVIFVFTTYRCLCCILIRRQFPRTFDKENYWIFVKRSSISVNKNCILAKQKITFLFTSYFTYFNISLLLIFLCNIRFQGICISVAHEFLLYPQHSIQNIDLISAFCCLVQDKFSLRCNVFVKRDTPINALFVSINQR